MTQLTQMVQKVRQAPWRVQRQWIGLILLVIVLLAMLAGIYLSVTVRAGIVGREIQFLSAQIEQNQQKNADLQTQLAALTAIQNMEARARALGFVPVSPEEITYIVVPGYVEKSLVDLSTVSQDDSVSLLQSEYFETLFDWLTRKIAVGVAP
jgi:cell division protein FtsL